MAVPASLAARPADVISRTSPDARHRLASASVLAAAGLVVAWLIAARMSYVPMWDGFVYAEAINDALGRMPSVEALRLAGHASHAYAAVAVAMQALSPGSAWPLVALHVGLLVAACVGFHRLLRLAFPGDGLTLERAALTAVFALQPSLLAAVVQPGLDLPVVPGLIWSTVLMLERRWVLAIIVALLTAFTKEIAILLYAVLLATYALWTFVRATGSLRARLIDVMRLAPLAIPGVVFGLYLVWRMVAAPDGEAVVWNAGTAMIQQSLVRQLLVPRVDRYLASFLAMMLILNFTWIVAGFTAVGAVAYGRRVLHSGTWRDRLRTVTGDLITVPGFLAVLAVGTVYALTRFATYANSRYVLPSAALLYVLFFASLLATVRRSTIRLAILFVLGVVTLVSNVATIDPVSRALYGTFAVGDRRMLRMTSITRECCGAGRDQLVYSLEFTKLEALLSDVLEGIAANDSTTVIVPDSTNWFVATRVDRTTHRRTVRVAGSASPRVLEDDDIVRGDSVPPSAAYFVALPNASSQRALGGLSSRYVVGPERRYTRGGYALAVYPLTAKR